MFLCTFARIVLALSDFFLSSVSSHSRRGNEQTLKRCLKMALKDGERQNNNEDEVRWRGRIGRRTFFGAFGLLVQHNTLDAWLGEVPKGSKRFRKVPRGSERSLYTNFIRSFWPASSWPFSLLRCSPRLVGAPTFFAGRLLSIAMKSLAIQSLTLHLLTTRLLSICLPLTSDPTGDFSIAAAERAFDKLAVW